MHVKDYWTSFENDGPSRVGEVIFGVSKINKGEKRLFVSNQNMLLFGSGAFLLLPYRRVRLVR